MSGRVASLDLLRGTAAFAVAIPHFLMSRNIGADSAETISILGVEVFFVLSGYVLAPQLLVLAERPSWHNLGIFWIRRWMRTVPPYLIALVLVSITSHQLSSADFVRYALYVQNLTHQANAQDYFSIAWSLSVEEWFYLSFPLALIGFRIATKRPALPAAIAFIAAVGIIRFLDGDWAHWGAEIRRVVIFRVDAIAWGFLLFVAIDRTRLMTIATPARAIAALAVTAIGAFMLTTVLAHSESRAIEGAFHLYASLLGAAAIVSALACTALIDRHKRLAATGLFLGRISYSVYLFHLIVLSAISGHLAWPIALLLHVAGTVAIAALMASAVEAPVLAARPSYRRASPDLKTA